MHTDRKIGFAMGILLIGIVAALFFRNEPLLSTRVPGVRRERELNQRLRERDVAVYLNDKESDKAPEQAASDQPWTLREVLQKMDERNKTIPVPVGKRKSSAANPAIEIDEENLDGYRPKSRRTSDASTVVESSSRSLTTIPGLVAPESSRGQFDTLPPLLSETPECEDITTSPSLPVSEPRAAIDGLGSDTPAADFQPPENFEEYIVKYGDTLSEIAQRMLGAQKRYMDIYNANRDRMASPDRLDVGKPLRIPRVAENERSTY